MIRYVWKQHSRSLASTEWKFRECEVLYFIVQEIILAQFDSQSSLSKCQHETTKEGILSISRSMLLPCTIIMDGY